MRVNNSIRTFRACYPILQMKASLRCLAIRVAFRAVGTLAVLGLPAKAVPVTIRAATVIDGRGGVLHNTTITVDGSKITRIAPAGAARVDFDLGNATLMPGWIDTHIHLVSHFNGAGRADSSAESTTEFILRVEGTAWETLQAGFTTVQSLGAESDKVVRDLINSGVVPGPRVLTSLTALTDKSGTREEIRAKVQKLVAAGADEIKIFATKSSRDGGAQSMTDAQIQAACSEARALSRRVAVHAHAASGAKAAILAGCNSIEHGTFLTDEVLDLMVQRGIYFNPNLANIPNYLEHKAAYQGIGNFTPEGFAEMAKDLPIRIDTLKRAMAKKVMIVFGTDAVGGLHGRNAEEFILRVRDAGQPAMDALISATSRAAASIGMGDKIGAIAEGMEADLVATDGNPLLNIEAVRKVTFVMKGGVVYKNLPPASR